jgi:hypothetical protein
MVSALRYVESTSFVDVQISIFSLSAFGAASEVGVAMTKNMKARPTPCSFSCKGRGFAKEMSFRSHKFVGIKTFTTFIRLRKIIAHLLECGSSLLRDERYKYEERGGECRWQVYIESCNLAWPTCTGIPCSNVTLAHENDKTFTMIYSH